MEADTSSDLRPVIPASEILAKIERGEPIEYDGVIVEGDLDISGLELPTGWLVRTKDGKWNQLSEVSSEITITNSEIQGHVKFVNAYFMEIINFEESKFSEDTSFFGAKFNEDTSFFGAKFNRNAYFQGAKFRRNADFLGTEFSGYAGFLGAKFSGYADFLGAKFRRNADFGRAEFNEDANFFGDKFNRDADFLGAKFRRNAYFRGAKFRRNADFLGAEFSGYADFLGTEFSGYAGFLGTEFSGYADFLGAEFSEYADFYHDQFSRDVWFTDMKFGQLASQEVACRIAKRNMENQGNKKAADDYFYREMEAIRLRNGIKGTKKMAWPWEMQVSEWLKLVGSKIWRLGRYDILEYIFIQGIFGYGVHPLRLFVFWILMAVTFASFYWYFDAVEGARTSVDYIWFSIATSATPGYALYNPIGNYKIVTGIQAIFGTFMWAAFIATFARKWQR